MGAEKDPRRITRTDIVLPYLRAQRSVEDIAAQTGLSRRQVTTATGKLYKDGVITREERRSNEPKPGSHRARVLEALRRGLNLDEITEELGNLTRGQVSDTATDLGKSGYCEPIGVGNYPRTEEYRLAMSKSRGGITLFCLPLLARGFSIRDVVETTGLKHEQVERSLHGVRKKAKASSELLPKPTQNETSAARSIAHVGIKRGEKKPSYTQEQEFDFAIARKLLVAGFIPVSMAMKERLITFYKRHERNLPASPMQQLRLEVFFDAVLRARQGDRTLLLAYKTLGSEVNLGWFQTSLLQEEAFIVVGTRSGGYGQDQRGTYRMVDGRKFRQLVESGEEGIIFDRAEAAKERRLNRERVRPGSG